MTQGVAHHWSVIAFTFAVCSACGHTKGDHGDAGECRDDGPMCEPGGTIGSGGVISGTGGAQTNSGGAAGVGGTVGTGGTSNSTAPTRGALSVEILPGCDAEAAVLNFPPVSSPPVSATSHSEVLENGGVAPDGTPALVTCNFTQVEPPYSISCRLEYGTVDEPHVAIFRAAGAPGTTADGNLALAGMQIGGQYTFTQYGSTLDAPCQYELLEADPVAGTVWGRITCSSLIDTSGQDSCSVGTSYFYFENCE